MAVSRQQRRANERAARKVERGSRLAQGAIALGAMLAAGSASAATFTVSNLNDSGSGSLRDAVSQANTAAGADTIVFQAGLTGTITLTTGEIPITDSVTINGPGAAAITVSGNNASRIFNIENSGATTPIDVNVNNLTISQGNSPSDGAAIRDNSENLTLDHVVINSSNAGADGGGLWFSGQNVASLTLTNCTITGNTSSLNGAGIAATYIAAPLSISNTTVSNNHAYGGNGAGISIDNTTAPVTINNSVISGNVVGEGNAGGLYTRYTQSTISVTNTSITNNDGGGTAGGVETTYAYASVYFGHDTISGNTAGYLGGGMAVAMIGGSTFTLQSSIVSNNTSGTFIYSAGYAGGLLVYGYNGNAQVQIADCVITGNVADPNDPLASPYPGTNSYDKGYGGGVILGYSNATIQRTTISGNTAYIGGGLYLTSSSTLVAENVTIANNAAKSPIATSYGGGVEILGASQATFNESTIVGNSTQAGGGGIDVCSCGMQTVLHNTIVANNTAATGTTPDINSTTGVAADYSLIKTPGTTTITAGPGVITGVDPNLGALADNNSTVLAGDPNATQQHPQTMLPICPSPVINAGDPAFTPPPATDERGMSRVSGGRIDMGAAEVQAGTVQFTTAAQSINGDAPNTLTVTASRSGGSEGAVQVNYATANGTATAGTDFTATSGTLSWADADSANKTFNVSILHDPTFDPNETFTVNLTSPTCTTLGATATQTETITESVLPTLSIDNVTANEGNSGTTPFTFTVTLSEPSSQTTTVSYATANGTATAGSDYTAASGIVTFNPGVTSQTITVNVTGDTACEPDETFTVNLSSPTNATIANGAGTGTITNDDPCSTDLAITKVANGKFFSGNPDSYTITVTNNGPAVATSAVVTDVLPGNTTFVSATPSQGSCSGTTTVTCSLGALGVGANATIMLTVMPTSNGPMSNTASVSATGQTDPTLANNSSTAATTVLPASDIPTLGETLLALLASVLAAIGAWFTRKA